MAARATECISAGPSLLNTSSCVFVCVFVCEVRWFDDYFGRFFRFLSIFTSRLLCWDDSRAYDSKFFSSDCLTNLKCHKFNNHGNLSNKDIQFVDSVLFCATKKYSDWNPNWESVLGMTERVCWMGVFSWFAAQFEVISGSRNGTPCARQLSWLHISLFFHSRGNIYVLRAHRFY